MARTIDPVRHQQRRLHIIDAALTCFAREGYEGATTASICRSAGIGSGTFFHYFPTKLDVLVAIIELGAEETVAWFAARAGRSDSRGVLREYVEHFATEFADRRLPGFVKAVGAVLGKPPVAQALRADEQATRAGLRTWVERAQHDGAVRSDLSADRLAAWMQVVLNGFVDQIFGDEEFDPQAERATLHEVIDRLLE